MPGRQTGTLPAMSLTPIQTLTLAILLLLLGYAVRGRFAVLGRINLPVPVIGGLLGAVAVTAYGGRIAFDTSLQKPLMVGFFTSVGFGASLRLLRRGGGAVLALLLLSSLLAVVQGLVGGATAMAFGLRPLAGVIMSTVTLSGGPATGLAFAPQFEAAGIHGAAAIATATAMAGILLASLFAAPVATLLLRRQRAGVASEVEAAPLPVPVSDPLFSALLAGGCILLAMVLGAQVSGAIEARGIVLPTYVGAMLVASLLRNAEDWLGRAILPMAAIELAGQVALSLFLVMAMMTLDLRMLQGLALPLLAGLAIQFAVTMAFCVGPVWWLMGRTYEATVTTAGVAGYMLGTTANAMAAMQALVERHGRAPKSFLAVPLVGSFLLDFTNAIIITGFLNLWR